MIKLNLKLAELADQADWLEIDGELANIAGRFGIDTTQRLLNLEIECYLQSKDGGYDFGNNKYCNLAVYRTGEGAYCAVFTVLNLMHMIGVTVAVTPFLESEIEFQSFEKVKKIIESPRVVKSPYFSQEEEQDLSDFMNLLIKNRIYNTPAGAAPVDDADELPPKKQGGKRNNSGRKASAEPLTPINIKVPESVLVWLDQQPQKSKYIISLIRADMEKNL